MALMTVASEPVGPASAGRGLPSGHWAQVHAFLASLLAEFTLPRHLPASVNESPLVVVEHVLSCLGSRRFTHLSRRQAEAFNDRMHPGLLADVRASRPLHFCLDLGPGYGASLSPGRLGLRLSPGLGEWLALRQIHAFSREVGRWYAPGVRFELVIDDLCAWVTNDVALADTAAYQARLCQLIKAVGMEVIVAVCSESDSVDPERYRAEFEQSDRAPVTAVGDALERENVSRFVGRALTQAEAADHIERYARALRVSQHLFGSQLRGVRLTQRATRECLGFRSFPGADCRIQTGEVMVMLTADGKSRLGLMTSRSIEQYQCWRIPQQATPAGWPGAIGAVMAASPTALEADKA